MSCTLSATNCPSLSSVKRKTHENILGPANCQRQGVTAQNGSSGDPSPVTANVVFRGLKAAVEFRLGRSELKGLSVAVQGIGHVGYDL